MWTCLNVYKFVEGDTPFRFELIVYDIEHALYGIMVHVYVVCRVSGYHTPHEVAYLIATVLQGRCLHLYTRKLWLTLMNSCIYLYQNSIVGWWFSGEELKLPLSSQFEMFAVNIWFRETINHTQD